VELLGPSDSSDSGSDSVGSPDSDAATDAAGTGEQRDAEHGMPPRDGADIGVDRVFSAEASVEGDDTGPVDDDDEEDPDLAFIDRARAEDVDQDEAQDGESRDA
jgi:hypothetical protein